jgi:hypothetical protein
MNRAASAGAGVQNQWDNSNLASNNQASNNIASNNLQSNQQSWSKADALTKDLIAKDRELSKTIHDFAKEENTFDHLQQRGWDHGTETRDFQTDKSANALGSNQMAASNTLNAGNSMNQGREVGGTDHLKQRGWDSGPETRDFLTDKTANAVSGNQGAPANYANTMNPNQEVGGVDHLKQRGWDSGAETRDFQTDKSANAMSNNQMAGANRNAGQSGEMEHLRNQASWDNGIEKRDLQADRGANSMSTNQMASNASNANYGTSANQANLSGAQSSQKEVGGTDHMSAQGQAGFDSQAQNRNLRS